MSDYLSIILLILMVVSNVIWFIFYYKLRVKYNTVKVDAFYAGKLDEAERIFGTMAAQLGYEKTEDFIRDMAKNER